jgi:cytoskeleton protein RodZ
VADVLNLPPDTVEAIETNNYELLPSVVFAKGYIRAYAKLLELDADPLVAAYPDAQQEPLEKETLPRDQFGELVRTHPQWVLGGGIALGGLLLILLAVLAWPERDGALESAVPAPAASVATAPAAEVAPAQPLAGPPAEGALAPSSQPAPTQETLQRSDAESVAEDTADTGLQGVAEGGSRRITPQGDDRLLFEFSEECWVEIKSASGSSLYSNLGRAGQSLELVGLAPFGILLGYAPGVSMAFNDEPVALGPHTRNNVANLVLGQ